MADIAIIFAAFAVATVAAGVILAMTPAAREKRRLKSEARKRRVSPSADDLASYLERLDQAGTDEDISRLERGEG